MDSDLTQSALFYKTWEWLETHRKQVTWGLGALVVVLIVGGFVLYRNHRKEIDAGEALSRVLTQVALGEQPSPEAFLGVATAYPGSPAAAKAVLLAGSRYFAEGKYADAIAQFERFLAENPESDLAGQAVYGRAASLEATGKTDAAITAYREIAERRPNENVSLLARLALGRLYISQGKHPEALVELQQVARGEFGTIGSEAAARRNKLVQDHPELIEPPPQVLPGTNMLPFKLENP
jgi:tetratricopeptide (TPR) repeat protein